MSDSPSTATRSAVDIRDDVMAIIVTNPPLAAERHHLRVSAEAGTVVLTGHTSTPINRQYLVARAAKVKGVTGVDDSALYDDVSLQLEVGRFLPAGLVAHSQYGIIVISGKVTADIDVDAIARQAAALPGVVKVVVQV